MHITHEVTIWSRPEAVFRWIEDPQLASRWQPDVVEYEITKANPAMVGTEFRERLGRGAGSMEMRGRVTSYVPNAQMAFELAGRGIRVRTRYVLAPAVSGTLLRVEIDLRLGGWLSFLLEPLVRRKLVRQVASEVERLRQLCEADRSH